MNAKALKQLGVPEGPPVRAALAGVAAAARAGLTREDLERRVRLAVMFPEEHAGDPHFGALARAVGALRRTGPGATTTAVSRARPAPWRSFGADLDPASIDQMENACRLPVTIAGALMPDAHVGYGLPIGGVLATDNAVIPYAVGVDIACRMRITALDIPADALENDAERKRFKDAIASETRFGVGASFRKPRDHEVMDDDWSVSPVTAQHKARAREQLGTSGSGNHFVEFGVLTIDEPALGLEPGEYLALMSHSGSRGAGAAVADHYSKLAMRLRPDLPPDLKRLAWLDLDSPDGREYWAAMELMGRYAAANHEVIHRELLRTLRARALTHVENHHNFAWKETHGGRDVVVHRKGATPAGRGVLGVIPGSMASPAYIVRGRGEADSLESASHGAGRVMSRRRAKSTFRWPDVKRLLADRNVELISAGIDEVPGVYKDIDLVMSQQADLVEVVARFQPRLVKMAREGERPED